MADSTVHLATTHVLRSLESKTSDPLFVAIQGPQGSGKTYLTSQLRTILVAPPHSLSVVTLSIDDLYLPHTDLVALAERHHPENVLLRGRGQPGTHDVQLGLALLHDLQRINTDPDTRVLLPVYDKSLHNGAGDRSAAVVSVCPPVDVVILEGWCVGFAPVASEEIERRWAACTRQAYRKDDILELNELLEGYVALWKFFTVFIQVGCMHSSVSGLASRFADKNG
jgi:D-glycerate 3-kinase